MTDVPSDASELEPPSEQQRQMHWERAERRLEEEDRIYNRVLAIASANGRNVLDVLLDDEANPYFRASVAVSLGIQLNLPQASVHAALRELHKHPAWPKLDERFTKADATLPATPAPSRLSD